MKVAVAQISCSLGDPETNLSKVRDFSLRAKEAGAELIVFPEMTDTGYWMPVIQKHADHWKTGFVARLQEITDYHPEYLRIQPPDVLAKLQSGDSRWEQMVPTEVAHLIKKREFFGYRRPIAA